MAFHPSPGGYPQDCADIVVKRGIRLHPNQLRHEATPLRLKFGETPGALVAAIVAQLRLATAVGTAGSGGGADGG